MRPIPWGLTPQPSGTAIVKPAVVLNSEAATVSVRYPAGTGAVLAAPATAVAGDSGVLAAAWEPD